MDNLSLYPHIKILKGFGTFSAKELEFESHFEVIHYPQNTIITTEIKDNKCNVFTFEHMTDYWSLNGLTEENFNVNAKNLIFTNLTGKKLTLYSYKDFTINISNLARFTSAEFPLVGLYKGTFKTEIDNWKLVLKKIKKELKTFSNKVRTGICS